MSLISLTFIIFTILLLAAYYLVPAKAQWGVLLVFSLIFYMWAHPQNIVFIGASVICTWALMRQPSRLRWILTLVINLAILVFFRYGVHFGLHDLIIPLGISFYTFMTLGYAHDC